MALWTPDQTTVALWLDASSDDFFTLDESLVSSWLDRSGNDLHASMSGSSRPTRATESVTFNGSTQYLACEDPALSNESSLFIVFKPVIESSVGAIVSQWAPGQTGRTVLSANQNSGGQISSGDLNFFNSTQTGGAGSAGFLNHTTITNAITLYGTTSNTGTGNFKAYKNGVLVDSCTITATLQSAFVIGSQVSGSSSGPYDGEISEIIVAPSSLSDANRKIFEGYLAHKWGIENNLPSDHPYKTSAPEYLAISGTVLDNSGDPAARTVRAYLGSTGELVASTTSNTETGAYEIPVVVDAPHTVVASGEPDRNALVLSGVEPA